MPEIADKPKRKRGNPNWVKGVSGNPAGGPKVVEEFRARCRRAVDEHVIDAWITEIEARGEYWMKAAELVAAYGMGRPPAAPEDREAVASRPLAQVSDAELLGVVASLLGRTDGT